MSTPTPGSPEPYKPGARYYPSNGTEGLGFIEVFCMSCERDRAFWEHDDPDGACPIATRAMAFHVDENGYPDEWTYTDEGKPTCTAFLPIGSKLPTDRDLEAAGQTNLLETP